MGIYSYDINSELDLHSHLLDDLDNAIDNTDTNLTSNTKKIADVQEKEASCIPLCIIFLLLIGIIVYVLLYHVSALARSIMLHLSPPTATSPPDLLQLFWCNNGLQFVVRVEPKPEPGVVYYYWGAAASGAMLGTG